MKKIFNSIKAIFKGMYIVLLHIFKKPVTIEYPEVRPQLNAFFRGKHSLENCMGCGYCQKVCPSDAIIINKFDSINFEYLIDLGKCIFCGNCMYYCPKRAINMTTCFELAVNNKHKLIQLIENKKR